LDITFTGYSPLNRITVPVAYIDTGKALKALFLFQE
jgi:hypothetical protein